MGALKLRANIIPLFVQREEGMKEQIQQEKKETMTAAL